MIFLICNPHLFPSFYYKEGVFLLLGLSYFLHRNPYIRNLVELSMHPYPEFTVILWPNEACPRACYAVYKKLLLKYSAKNKETEMESRRNKQELW